jgi:hypothetical protein
MIIVNFFSGMHVFVAENNAASLGAGDQRPRSKKLLYHTAVTMTSHQYWSTERLTSVGLAPEI